MEKPITYYLVYLINWQIYIPVDLQGPQALFYDRMAYAAPQRVHLRYNMCDNSLYSCPAYPLAPLACLDNKLWGTLVKLCGQTARMYAAMPLRP